MDHCGGGPGVDSIGQTLLEKGNDLEDYFERWLNGEDVPLEIKGVHTGKDGKPEWESPVCAYPEFPAYITGDEKLGSSFSCRERARGGVPDSSAYLR
jgi:feruloyl esterase